MRILTDTQDYWPQNNYTGTVTQNFSKRWAGTSCAKCPGGEKNTIVHQLPTLKDEYYYFRTVFQFSELPTTTQAVMMIEDSAAGRICEMSYSTAGKLGIFNNKTSTHPIETSPPTLVPGEWYVGEIMLYLPTTGSGYIAARINGFEFVQKQIMNVGNNFINNFYSGNVSSSTPTVYIDSVAVNDSRFDENTSWPGVEPDVRPEANCEWGATMAGDHYDPTWDKAPYDLRTWNKFEENARRKVGLVGQGDPWLTWDGYQPGVASNTVRSRDAFACKAIGHSITDVLEGKQDTAITTWAKEAAAYGGKVYLRPWYEFNGTWFEWGGKSNFVEGWKYLYNKIKPIAPNVEFVWCATVIDTITGDSKEPAKYYPGDAYVDWTAFDGYTGENPAKKLGWKSPHYRFQMTYARLLEIAPHKPMMICETAASEYCPAGKSKAGWIADLLGNALPYTMPKVTKFMWFNWNIEEGEPKGSKMDWAIETSEAAKSAFAAGINSSYYTPAQANQHLGVEYGAVYELVGPNGARAVFNDDKDPDFVGSLSAESSGLDSADVREDAEDATEADGGVHGNFWYGRRPVVLQGQVSATSKTERNNRVAKLKLASNAMRDDARLTWQPEGGPEVYLDLRRQQPVRITKGFVKEFQVPLVAASIYPRSATSKIVESKIETNTKYLTKFPTSQTQIHFGGFGEHEEGLFSPPISGIETEDGTFTKTEGMAEAKKQIYLVASKFGYAVPTTATIRGVEVGIKRRALDTSLTEGANEFKDNEVRLVDTETAGGLLGENKAKPEAWPYWTGSGSDTAQWAFYGGKTDKWGATITPTKVNHGASADEWGIALTPERMAGWGAGDKAEVDAMKMTVYWQEAATVSNQLVCQNDGDADALPKVVIKGAIDNPIVVNTTTGKMVKIDYSLGEGSVMVIDFEHHTVMVNNSEDIYAAYDFPVSDWWTLIPGSNVIAVNGEYASSKAKVEIIWNDTYV